MFGSSHARSRQLSSVFCLICIAMLNVVILGTVGVNGRFKNQGRCNLYFRGTTSVSSNAIYNNGYCTMPIVVTAILALASGIFAGYQIMVIHRYDEYHPRGWSLLLLGFSILAALMSFAMCIEIALGIQVACSQAAQAGYGHNGLDCRSHLPFGALYVAQVCAGIMGGLWIVVTILEWIQYKSRPSLYTASSTPMAREEGTSVIPHTREAPSADHWHDDGHGNLHHHYIPSARPPMTSVSVPTYNFINQDTPT